jgi:hypothetical protein
LEATALVHEFYLKASGLFIGTAARLMRNILVDGARAELCRGHQYVPIATGRRPGQCASAGRFGGDGNRTRARSLRQASLELYARLRGQKVLRRTDPAEADQAPAAALRQTQPPPPR